MNDQHVVEEKYQKRQNRSLGKSIAKNMESPDRKRVMTIAISVGVWIVLVVGGYLIANQFAKQTQSYIDQRLDKIEATNQKQIEKVESDLESVQNEMSNVQSGLAYIGEELKMTGETIGGSDKTKQALQQRVDQLNKQLVDLKASLKRLEDATRAY